MRLYILFLLPLIASCSGGGAGGGSAPSVTGLDLTGTWRTAGVECYDSSLQTLTAVAVVSQNSSVGTINITNNNLDSSSLGDNSCRVDISRSFVANLSRGTASGGIGNGNLGASTASVPGGSCSGTTSFTATTGSINPSTFTSTYTQGQAVSAQNFQFVINPPYLGLTSLIQVVGRPTDICFIIYQKM